MNRILLYSQIFLAVLFVALMLLVFHQSDQGGLSPGEPVPVGSWEVSVGNDSTEMDALPDRIDSQGTGEVSLTKVLPSDVTNEDALIFFSVFQDVTVTSNGKVIYELSMPAHSISTTPGKVWNFVPLTREMAGHSITVTLRNNYGTEMVDIPEFSIGPEGVFAVSFMSDQVWALIVSFLLLALSFVGWGYWYYAKKQQLPSEGVPTMSWLFFFVGIWSLAETQVLPLIFGHPLLSNQIAFLSLYIYSFLQVQLMMTILALQKDVIMNILKWATFLGFVITVVLQLLGIADFMQSSGIFIVLNIIAIIYGGYILIKTFWQNRKNKRLSHYLTVYLCILAILGLFNIVSDVYSMGPNVIDSARIMRFGFLIMAFGLIWMLLSDSFKLIEEGKKAGLILEMASLDDLTKLKNRKAYQHDLESINNGDKQDIGIMMCDLNNLKLSNDTYGHEVGDLYITTAGQLLEDQLSMYGKVYRIGGDEFCAIVRGLTPSVAESIGDTVNNAANQSMQSKLPNCTYTMGVATGFAQFNPEIDVDISDTVKRADAMMYKKKSTMKHRGNNRAEDVVEEASHV